MTFGANYQLLTKTYTSRLKKNWCTKEAGLASLVVFAFIFIIREVYLISPTDIPITKRRVSVHVNNPYLIQTPVCRIPNMQAHSPEAMEFMANEPAVDCGKPPLVTSNDTHLQIDFSVLPKYGIQDVKKISCCYRHMWRHIPDVSIKPGDMRATVLYDGKKYDNDIRYAKECTPFTDSAQVNVEFVRVECEANKTEIYTDYHGFIPAPKPVQSHVNESSYERRINVVIFGIDSLSRLNMIRKMPMTYNYLTNVLGAFPMYGYNKVGENTFPNIVPLLSGYHVKELEICWANNSAKFDLCPFIWKAFNFRGYATAFIEDTAWMGLFMYLKKGFVFQQTQYDPRPILYQGEKEAGHNKGLNSYYCIGPRLQIQMLVEYTYKLLRRLHHFKQNHFVYSWGTSFSHDYINEPQNADVYYYNLLKQTYSDGLQNDTAVIFMSDHGIRFGPILKTEQGRIEGSLPAFYIVLPKWFQHKYPVAMKNLKINQERLVTPFDLHQTFNDLMDLRSLAPEFLNTRKMILERGNKKDWRGISLFTAVPETRDCEAAGIPAEFCSCRQSEEINTDAAIIKTIVFLAIGEINEKLRQFPDCIPLVLNNITRATFEETDQESGIEKYRVTFETEPGGGQFSALVSHKPKDNSLKLLGDISRLNAYGNQSLCVPVSTLRPYCFCVNQD